MPWAVVEGSGQLQAESLFPFLLCVVQKDPVLGHIHDCQKPPVGSLDAAVVRRSDTVRHLLLEHLRRRTDLSVLCQRLQGNAAVEETADERCSSVRTYADVAGHLSGAGHLVEQAKASVRSRLIGSDATRGTALKDHALARRVNDPLLWMDREITHVVSRRSIRHANAAVSQLQRIQALAAAHRVGPDDGGVDRLTHCIPASRVPSGEGRPSPACSERSSGAPADPGSFPSRSRRRASSG